MMGKLGKRGDTTLLETIMFIVLNAIFFVALIVFAYMQSSGAALYEQTYAKQIGLLIDEARPMMTITLDIGKGIELAKKSGVTNLDGIVRIDESKKEVVVGLTGRGGYKFQYFSDYDVSVKVNEPVVVISIKEKNVA